jgi:hypothetical protein
MENESLDRLTLRSRASDLWDEVATQSLVKREGGGKICEASWSSGSKSGCCGTEATGGFHQARWLASRTCESSKARHTGLDRGFKVF